MAVDPTIVALIGTVMGGVGLKVVEHWLGKNKVKVDDASLMRTELRLEITNKSSEITALREEIKDLEVEVEKWRKEYYDLFLKYSALETDLKLALHNIKMEAESAQLTTEELSKQPPVVPPTIP